MMKLSKNTGRNNYIIKLILENKQPFYEQIYYLGLVELEILETYIKT